MSKKLCFEVHTYAPELSKVYFIRNGKKIQYELPGSQPANYLKKHNLYPEYWFLYKVNQWNFQETLKG